MIVCHYAIIPASCHNQVSVKKISVTSYDTLNYMQNIIATDAA